jgi:hypothetical protein
MRKERLIREACGELIATLIMVQIVLLLLVTAFVGGVKLLHMWGVLGGL